MWCTMSNSPGFGPRISIVPIWVIVSRSKTATRVGPESTTYRNCCLLSAENATPAGTGNHRALLRQTRLSQERARGRDRLDAGVRAVGNVDDAV